MNVTTTTATANPEPLTIEKIREALSKLEALGPEPFSEFMRKQGMPPEDGYILLLPDALRSQVCLFLPDYVHFSEVVEQPCIYLDLMRGLKAAMLKRNDGDRKP